MEHGPPHGRYRRRFLQGATVAVGMLAGCLGGSTQESVPERYRTAESQGGLARNPEQLQSQAAANYRNEPGTAGRDCAGCSYYIPATEGDDRGACAVVAGRIAPNGYCPLYVQYRGESENGTEDTPRTGSEPL